MPGYNQIGFVNMDPMSTHLNSCDDGSIGLYEIIISDPDGMSISNCGGFDSSCDVGKKKCQARIKKKKTSTVLGYVQCVYRCACVRLVFTHFAGRKRSTISITDASITDASIADASITDASVADASVADASISAASVASTSISAASIAATSISSASISAASFAFPTSSISFSAFSIPSITFASGPEAVSIVLETGIIDVPIIRGFPDRH